MVDPDRSPAQQAYLDLLRPGGHGVVAATSGAVPVILPVAFELRDDHVTFEVSSPDGPNPDLDGAVIAFDTANVDETAGLQWHVQVLGIAMATGIGVGGQRVRFALSTDITSGWIGEG